MGKRSEQTLFQRNIQMADKNMKVCSTVFVISELQIKTIMKWYLTPMKTAKMQK